MITLPRKLFCFILVGLASLAVASVCSLLHLEMHQAIILFLGTWLALIALSEMSGWLGPERPPEEPPEER